MSSEAGWVCDAVTSSKVVCACDFQLEVRT